MKEELSTYQVLAAMGIVGVVTALGQLLASHERLTSRIIAGRALSSIGLSVSAGAILLWVADPHPLALIGVSAGLASLGTSFLEKLVQKKFGINP
jgi:hypothetical protein